MRIVMTVVYLLLVMVGVSFAVLNASTVSINLYLTTLQMPISLLMTITLGFGILLGLILFLARYWRLKGENRKLRNQLKLTEKEIKNLRAIPLSDQH